MNVIDSISLTSLAMSSFNLSVSVMLLPVVIVLSVM